MLFRLVDQGHARAAAERRSRRGVDGLTFNALRADLFRPTATALIDEVGLGNARAAAGARATCCSARSRAAADRGFISYAELGINQLGAVYEGLMSYTGFFAETDLYEVAKDGDSEKGSWVVPVDRAPRASPTTDFVTTADPVTGESKPVAPPRGTFVFRLAGRERQQSASYYTPEVLTRFVVSQALEELLDQDGTTHDRRRDPRADRSASRRSARARSPSRRSASSPTQYLKRRQDELGETIDPDEYPRELQKVKAYLALQSTASTSTRPPSNSPRSRCGSTPWSRACRRRGSACTCGAATR